MKRTFRRAVSLGFQTYEDTLEVEFDETKDGYESWLEVIEERFEKEVLDGAIAWYNKIKETPEFKEQQQAKQSKGGFKPQGGKQDYKKDFANKGGNPYGKKKQQSGGSKQNGSEEGNYWVEAKGFGTGKQWDIILKKGIEPETLNSYGEMQDAIKS